MGVGGRPPEVLGKRHAAKAKLLGKNKKEGKKYTSPLKHSTVLIFLSRYYYRVGIPVLCFWIPQSSIGIGSKNQLKLSEETNFLMTVILTLELVFT